MWGAGGKVLQMSVESLRKKIVVDGQRSAVHGEGSLQKEQARHDE